MKAFFTNGRFTFLVVGALALAAWAIAPRLARGAADGAAIPTDAVWVDARSKADPPDGSRERPFTTLREAVAAAGEGGTVVVRAGIYREAVSLPGGQPGKPFTLMGFPGERAVISGLQTIGGWKKHAGRVFVAEVDWRPPRLYIDYQAQTQAREPNEGWWRAAKVEEEALIDTERLGALSKPLAGAEVYIWTQNGNTFFTVPVAELDQNAGRLAVVRQSKWMTLKGGDKYYLQNHPSLIDRPGEWAVAGEDGKYRVYFWPPDEAALERVEAPRIDRQVVSIQRVNHVRLENLEITGGVKNGVYAKDVENIEISRCTVHHNGALGISIRAAKDVRVARNVVWRNEYGVSFHTAERVLVEMNDIGYNGTDGLLLTWGSADLTVRKNYLHDHLLWGHPDNLQLYRDVKRPRIVDNLLIAAGQSVMLEETTDGEFRGNTMVGCGAYMLIFGHGNADRFKVHNNTLAFAGYGCMSLTGSDYDVRENIFVTGHGSPAYGIKGVKGYVGDRNLFWGAPGLTDKRVMSSDKGWHRTFEEYQQATGKDARSIYADPKFVNAPAAFHVLDGKRLHECTRERLFLRGGSADLIVGDRVEINFDGRTREVVRVDDASITVKPGLTVKPIKDWLVANWRDKTDFALDLRLKPNSPGMQLAEGGMEVGSKIDIQAYKRGDFDGDGQRDIPDLPPELAQ